MFLKQNLNLYKAICITWKSDILMLAYCSLTYVIYTKWLPHVFIPAAYPAFMGTAIAFFIGFNNTQAYSRWWEARSVWGSLVNDSRTWCRSLLNYNGNRTYAIKMIRRHISFINALTNHLHHNNDNDYFKYLDKPDKDLIDTNNHIPDTILDLQAVDLNYLKESESIDHITFLGLNEVLRSFCDSLGKCERISSTVFPVTYVYFTKLFIWLIIALITMASSNETGAASIILGWIVGFVFYSTHLNGMSIMEPLKPQPSGIPILSIARNIEITLLKKIKAVDIPLPTPIIDDEYIL